jgi:hypothetical protein
MGTWMNSDGLYIKFGTDEAAIGTAGEYRTTGPQRMAEVKLTLTSLLTTTAILDDNNFIPAGARIEKVEVVTETAVTSGGAATLNVGLIRRDRTTAIDEDGLIAALAIASFNAAGETVVLTNGVTSAGALVGTTLANSGYLAADYDTAAFTAGVSKVRVYWSKP